jgi:hypothetical protein
MGNYVSDQVGNYVSGNPLQLGNYVSADMVLVRDGLKYVRMAPADREKAARATSVTNMGFSIKHPMAFFFAAVVVACLAVMIILGAVGLIPHI